MTEITILNGGKEFKYYTGLSRMDVITQTNRYGFIELSNRDILKVHESQVMILKEVE